MCMLLLCSQQIEEFRALAKEIMSLDSIVHFDMVRLDCEDLKRGLAEKSRGYANTLLDRVATDHRQENERWACVATMISSRLSIARHIISWFAYLD